MEKIGRGKLRKIVSAPDNPKMEVHTLPHIVPNSKKLKFLPRKKAMA
jgi:hypothetical protein